MNRNERLQAHWVSVPDYYLPDPQQHLLNPRDCAHFEYSRQTLTNCKTVLDVGCWDGWLDFLLIKEGFEVEGVEVVTGLGKAAQRYADIHNLKYKVYDGFFEELLLEKKYDAVLCYETLEHVHPQGVERYIAALEATSGAKVLISLPNQKHEDNSPQHLWTPTLEVITQLFGHKPNLNVIYRDYPGTTIPGNWFIHYTVK